jgi:cytochrome c5
VGFFSARAALLAGVGLLWTTGCAARRDSPAARYLRDRPFRRAALTASIVDPDNAYSRLRLAHYASGDEQDWDRLPAWNPRVTPLRPEDLRRGGPAPRDPGARVLADAGPESERLPDEAALRRLGERAFFTYPVQLAPPVPLSADAASRYGWWVDDRRGVGGLVWAEMPDGSRRLELTCATCHADQIGGRLVAGVPNGHVQVGRMLADAGRTGSAAAASLAWGPGRVDVTTTDGSVPERMADLRPIRWASHLQYDATLRQQSVVSLAIRIETLIITSKNGALRPPRVLALALAVYLWTLADALPPLPSGSTAGAALFEEHCADCHAGPDLGGGPVTLAVVGTDPLLGRSPERGTGAYRAPSLRGVADRPTLLHDGTLPNVWSLLDPARLDPAYRGGARAAGPVRGHRFGLDLNDTDRRALATYVQAL